MLQIHYEKNGVETPRPLNIQYVMHKSLFALAAHKKMVGPIVNCRCRETAARRLTQGK